MTQPAVFDHQHTTTVESPRSLLISLSDQDLVDGIVRTFDTLATVNKLTELLYTIGDGRNDDEAAQVSAEALDTLTVLYVDLVAVAALRSLIDGGDHAPGLVAHVRVAKGLVEVIDARVSTGTLTVVSV